MIKTMEKEKYKAEIDSHLCKACEYCTFVCPVDMFQHSGKINSQGYDYMKAAGTKECIGCLRCVNICPDFAITIHTL